jgi:hypothetical protein
MWSRIEQVYTDVQFARQIRGDARRTIYCHADDAERLRSAVEAQGVADILTVTVSPLAKAGQMLVADTAAYDAAMAQTMQKLTKGPW